MIILNYSKILLFTCQLQEEIEGIFLRLIYGLLFDISEQFIVQQSTEWSQIHFSNSSSWLNLKSLVNPKLL